MIGAARGIGEAIAAAFVQADASVFAVDRDASTLASSAATAGASPVVADVTDIAALIPLGRFADPSEMTAAIGFLASAEAGYITGVVLPVDGGLSM